MVDLRSDSYIFNIDNGRASVAFSMFGNHRIEDLISIRLLIDRYINEGQEAFTKYINESKIAHYEEAAAYEQASRASRIIPEKQDRPKVIYLLFDSHSGLYKIGKTKNLQARLNTLKTANAAISMVHSFDGFDSCELILHENFATKRVTGEWFMLDDDDICFVKNYSPISFV